MVDPAVLLEALRDVHVWRATRRSRTSQGETWEVRTQRKSLESPQLSVLYKCKITIVGVNTIRNDVRNPKGQNRDAG